MLLPESTPPFLNLLKRAIYSLIGAPGQFKLENQVFNAICVIAIIIVGYNVPFSYYTGLKVATAIFGILFLSFCITYYLARFKRQLKFSVIISSVMVLLMLGTNYFFNAGVRGPSLLSFTLAFFLIMIISPRKQYWLWSVLSLGTGLGLLFFEYKNPQDIQSTYTNDAAMFIDMASTYVINILVIFVGLYYLKTAYYKEKRSAEAKAQMLERMNHEKTKFFSIISHDLRSPLASIQSYMELFRMDILTEEEKEMMERKLTNAESSTQEMLDKKLSWSKAQLNDGKVNLEVNNLSEALAPVISIQKAASKEKKIKLTHQIDPVLAVMSDVHMLQLIVRNIIGNAIKFTPEEGLIQLSVSKSEQHCLIKIQDNGNGIPKESKAEIFSLKAQSTYGTANEKGIGLGLFLCREYTHAQGGKIWFESQVGIGTTFYVALPLDGEAL